MKRSILVLSAYPFTNETAGQRNTNSVINDLIAIGYEVSAICFSYPNQESKDTERFISLKSIRRNRLQSYVYSLICFFIFPLYTRRLSLRVIYFLLRHQSEFKYIYLDYSQTFIYSWFIRDKRKIVLNVHDVNIQKYRRYYTSGLKSAVMLPYIFFSEKLFFKKAVNILVLSFKDKELMSTIYKKKTSVVLPKSSFPNQRVPVHLTVDLKKFLFIGAWNRYENVHGLEWFINKIHPLLKKTYQFIIAGSNLPENISKSLPGNFSSAGFVDNLEQLIAGVSAVITPLFFGAGIKFKVLDALSNGCRVIGTPVAFEGIEINADNACLICSTPLQFKEAIEYCASNSFNKEPIEEAFQKFLQRFETASNLIDRDFA